MTHYLGCDTRGSQTPVVNYALDAWEQRNRAVHDIWIEEDEADTEFVRRRLRKRVAVDEEAETTLSMTDIEGTIGQLTRPWAGSTTLHGRCVTSFHHGTKVQRSTSGHTAPKSIGPWRRAKTRDHSATQGLGYREQSQRTCEARNYPPPRDRRSGAPPVTQRCNAA